MGRVAIGFGVFYIVLGIVGFFFVGLDGSKFFGLNPDQAILGLITLNGMHNVAHIGFGALLVVAAAVSSSMGREDVVRGGLIGLGAIYAVATIVGFAGAFTEFLNIPTGARGIPDNLFHALSAIFLFAAGFARSEATVGSAAA
ncbi:MAG: DUF4383 domain-containing protein [Actinomycetota bacterium]